MPKTVSASRISKSSVSKSKPDSKKSAKKPVKSVKRKSSAAMPVSKKRNWWDVYVQQRDDFYATHPYSRFLIGLLIVSVAVAFGMAIHDWKEVYVGMQLDKEGIEYPYIKPVGIK